MQRIRKIKNLTGFHASAVRAKIANYINSPNIQFTLRAFQNFTFEYTTKSSDPEEGLIYAKVTADIYIPGFCPVVVLIKTNVHTLEKKHIALKQCLGPNVRFFYVTDEMEPFLKGLEVFEVQTISDDNISSCGNRIIECAHMYSNRLYSSVESKINLPNRDETLQNENIRRLEEIHTDKAGMVELEDIIIKHEFKIDEAKTDIAELNSQKTHSESDLLDIKQCNKFIKEINYQIDSRKREISDFRKEIGDKAEEIVRLETRINKMRVQIDNDEAPKFLQEYEAQENRLFWGYLGDYKENKTIDLSASIEADDIVDSPSWCDALVSLWISISTVIHCIPKERSLNVLVLFDTLLSLWEDEYYDMTVLISGRITEQALYSIAISLGISTKSGIFSSTTKIRDAIPDLEKTLFDVVSGADNIEKDTRSAREIMCELQKLINEMINSLETNSLIPKRTEDIKPRSTYPILATIIRNTAEENTKTHLQRLRTLLSSIMDKRNDVAHAQDHFDHSFSSEMKDSDATKVYRDLSRFMHGLAYVFQQYCYNLAQDDNPDTAD